MSIEEQRADFESEHIEGYAREGFARPDRGRFSVPLISHVEGNLWQGGCLPGVRLPDDFDYVVSLYKWGQYELGPDTGRIEIEMYDRGSMPDIDQLYEIAELVNEKKAKGKILVHCQAGLNRSGLIAGLSLILDGMEPQKAIDLLREKRCDVVLCNKTFETWLLSLADKKEEE
jgi:protein-tyrosine phosphatase